MEQEKMNFGLTSAVIFDVSRERISQFEKRGKQRKTNLEWLPIFLEEVGEIAQAMQKGEEWSKESDAADLYNELIQAAAVAIQWAEQLKEKELNMN